MWSILWMGICKLKHIHKSRSVRRFLTFLPWMVSRLYGKYNWSALHMTMVFLVCSWECQTIITVSQFHKWIEIILKEDSQCYQARRHLIHLILLLMHNEMQKSLSFLQTIWLMEEMLLIFDTSVGGVVISSGGHDQSSKLTWSDREMNREFVREMNRWINKRMFNVPTVTFRKGNTNTRWVVSAKQQYGRGRFRDESGAQYELVSSMVLQKKEMSP